jgi:hypothetical protein
MSKDAVTKLEAMEKILKNLDGKVTEVGSSIREVFIVMKMLDVSHPILQGKPNASHMCARINLHTHDRQNESNTIAVIKRSRVKPVRYPLLHPERWTQRSEHNDN